ncbi:MAG: hypothetical protein E7672_02390 [Ruminococcaceae bacterium]|nr:hypothetical protein [Oscillospiraceae bacterium]
MAHIGVDFNNIIGNMKIMHSVNNAPVTNRERKAYSISNAKYFKEAGIPYCRNHDASFFWDYEGEYIVDVHRIFRDFDADVNDPASYDFYYTDLYVQSVEEVGAHTFYRLGTRIEHGKKVGAYPPKDYFKWAQICEHIIRHYTEGWADGFNYNMEYWEIWNEAHGGESCWVGTMEEFYKFFTVAYKHLKETFPHLKIGGPALCHCNDDKFNHEFFDEMKKQGLVLDFFSFHLYTNDPHDFYRDGEHAYELLCEYGLENHTELILNEWNYVRGWFGDDYSDSLHFIKDNRGFKASSLIAAVMAVGQASKIDHLMYYDAAPGVWNSMFDTVFMSPNKGYYPFKMFGDLYRMGKNCFSSSDDKTLFAVAASGENCGGVMLTHFIDDDNTPDKTVTIDLENLPGEGMKTIEYYILDKDNDMKLIRRDRTTAESLSTEFVLPVYNTIYIKVI